MRVYTIGSTSFDLDEVRVITTPRTSQWEPLAFEVYLSGISKAFQFVAQTDSEKAEVRTAFEKLFTAWSGKEPPGAKEVGSGRG